MQGHHRVRVAAENGWQLRVKIVDDMGGSATNKLGKDLKTFNGE